MAQIALSKTDIGNPGIPGTYTYSSGTYTVSASGSGIGGTSDQFTFVNTLVSGNIEMTTYVASQTGTSINPYAVSGLMVRDSLNANAANAFISVSPKNGVNFSYRLSDGSTTSTTLGPSLVAPVYLRLVVSSGQVAGYQSSDGLNWNLVGTCNLTLTGSYNTGFAVSSFSNQNTVSSNFQSVHLFTNVPQVGSHLSLWLRGDIGAITNGSNVTAWLDQSGNNNNALAVNNPLFAPNTVNGLPSINFNGSNNYFTLPAGFETSNGCSIFVVTMPGSVTTSGENLINLGNNPSNDVAISLNSNLTTNFYIYQGTTAQYITTPNTFSQAGFNVIEAHQNGSSTGYIYINGNEYSSTLSAPQLVTRSNNYIGANSPGGLFFNGKIAEILVYNTYLTTDQRQSVESYLNSKYNFNIDTLQPPTISPNSGVYSVSQSVKITNPNDSGTVYYTLDGSIPNANSNQYLGQFTLTNSAIVNAVVIGNSQTSTTATQYINIDPYSGSVPTTNMALWLKSDFGILTNGTNVVAWHDLSGNNVSCDQSNTGNQPKVNNNVINGFPSVSFNGSTQYLKTLSLPTILIICL